MPIPQAAAIAIAAAYGIGIIESFEEAIDQIEIHATFYPNKDNYLYYSEMYQVFRSLYNSVLTQYDMLSDIEKKFKEKKKILLPKRKGTRNIILIQPKNFCPKIYPRKVGKPKKNPL